MLTPVVKELTPKLTPVTSDSFIEPARDFYGETHAAVHMTMSSSGSH